MKPIDYRNTTWLEIQDLLKSGLRERVYTALSVHGPCTTRELAERSSIDILNVRPRVTELCQLGFAACDETEGLEGTYRAVVWHAAKYHFDQNRAAALDTQLPLI